jgi:MFS family permease
MNPKKPSEHISLWKIALYFSGLGAMFAACIVIGYFLGGWIAERFDLSPAWKGIGAISGIAAGIVNTVLLVKRYLEEQDP